MKFVFLGIFLLTMITGNHSVPNYKNSVYSYFGNNTPKSERIKRFFLLSDCEKLNILDSLRLLYYDSIRFYKFPSKRLILKLNFDYHDSVLSYFINKTNYANGVNYGFGGIDFPDNNKIYKDLVNEWRRKLNCVQSNYDTSTREHGHPVESRTSPINSYLAKISDCDKLDTMESLYRINKHSDYLLFLIFYMEDKTGFKSSAKQYWSGLVYNSDSLFDVDMAKWGQHLKCKR